MVHNLERPWIYWGENMIGAINDLPRQESALEELSISRINGIIANNAPLATKAKGMNGSINLGTHGEVMDVTLCDGRRGIAKFSEDGVYGADMHVELRRGLELERLGLTIIYGSIRHPQTGGFGFVMAPMGESLRHWEYPESDLQSNWITDRTFLDLNTIFARMQMAAIPHPDIQFGITRNGRLLLFDYDYQRVDESLESLLAFRKSLPELLSYETNKLTRLRNGIH